MGKFARAVLLAIATVAGALAPAYGQSTNNPPPPTIIDRGTPITPLGWFVMGSIGCAAVSPMIGTVILGRELTLNEAYRSTLGCFLGPIGWLLADALVPPTVITQIQTQTPTPTSKPPPRQQRTGRGRNFKIPPQGETRFVANEILLEFAPGATAQMRNTLANTLQLTELETQRFELTGRTLSRWRIGGTRSVPATLSLIARNYPGVSGGWANMVYVGAQTPAPAVQ
jgi:hypothetical protein